MKLSSPYLIVIFFQVILLSSCSKPTDVELKEETDLKTLINEYVLISTTDGSYIMFPDGSGLEKISSFGEAIWMNNRASFANNAGTKIIIYNTLTKTPEKNIATSDNSFTGLNMQYSPILNLFILNVGRISFIDMNGKRSTIPLNGISDGRTSQVDDWLYYRDSRNGYKGLYRMTLGSYGKLDTLDLNSTYTYGGFTVSHDGKFLAAYASSGSSQLLKIINTSTKAILTINLIGKMNTAYYDPAFSRRGEYVYMIGAEAKSIYAIKKDGTGFTKIHTFDFGVTRISFY